MGDNGAGKSTLVKIIAGNFPPTDGRDRCSTASRSHFHKPVDARAAGHRDRLPGPRAVRQPDGGRERLPRPRAEARRRPVRDPRLPRRCTQRAGELFAELKSETRPRDLVRQMSGGQRQAVAIARTRLSNAKIVLMDEPTAAISVRQVAEVLEPDPAAARPGHRRRADQPPHARRVRRRATASSCCAAAARSPTRRSPTSSPEEVTGLITGAIRARLRRAAMQRHAPAQAQRRASRTSPASRSSTALQRLLAQPAVLGDGRAARLICAVMSWLQPRRLRHAPTISSTSPATSPSSASWRSA